MGKGWRYAAALVAALVVGCGGGGGDAPTANALTHAPADVPVAVQYDYGPLLDRLTAGAPAWQTMTAAQLTRDWALDASAVADEVDGRELLRLLFARVTAGQTTDEGKVVAWVTYLQNRIAHPKWNPEFTDGTHITEPLWVLENQLGKCGATNRVLVDGLLIAGFQARIVILLSDHNTGHQGAEVFYGGAWHYVDADWLSNGEFVRKADGSIASAAEIHADPTLLAAVDPEFEFTRYAANVRFTADTLAMMFHTIDSYLYKTATPEQEAGRQFGWEFYRYER